MRNDAERFFEQLYRENFGQMNRYANVHLDPSQAEEAVQDTFHDALEKIDILLSHENPSGWLMVTLKYKISNYQRARQRDMLRLVSLDSLRSLEVPAVKSAEQMVEEKEDQAYTEDRIHRALSKRELYTLKRLICEKATHKELSEELGITVWTSQKRLERIREKLDKLFPDHGSKK